MPWKSSEFFEILVRPYIEPFSVLLKHSVGVMTSALAFFISMVTFVMTDLFATPEIWWRGLMALVILDTIAGHLRVFTDPHTSFNIKKWGSAAYKISSYIIVGLSVSAGANMFPEVLGWIQYVTFSFLAGIEIHSILKNLKMLALLDILIEMASKRTQVRNMEDFHQQVHKKQEERENEGE